MNRFFMGAVSPQWWDNGGPTLENGGDFFREAEGDRSDWPDLSDEADTFRTRIAGWCGDRPERGFYNGELRSDQT